MKIVFEKYLPDFGEDASKGTKMLPDELEIQDGGAAVSYQFDDGKDEGLFVELRSWATLDERIVGRHDYDVQLKKLREAHPDMHKLAGRHIRITIETLDEVS